MLEKSFNILSQLALSSISVLKILVRSGFFIRPIKSKNRQIYLLGNGPSLKKDISRVKDSLSTSSVLTVNAFPSTDLFEEIKPDYFLVSSPSYYSISAKDYNVDVRKKIIENLVAKTSWPLVFFLPAGSKKNKKFISYIKSNKFIIIQHYNTTPVDGLTGLNHLFYRLGLGLPRPHNVLVPSLLRAINLGYEEIIFLGADHSWLPELSVNSKNQVLVNQKHFYDEESSIARQMHKNEGRGNRRIHEVLHKFMLTFEAYHSLNDYAVKRGVKIVNLTEASFIDAFDKKDIQP